MTTNQLADLLEEAARRLRSVGPIGPKGKISLLKTEKEIMALLSVSRKKLQSLRSSRLIPFVKMGKSVRFNPEAVERALEKLTIPEIGTGRKVAR